MEIGKTNPVTPGDRKVLREGDVVRVKVLRDAGGETPLVDVKGRTLSARLSGGINSPLFIARVVRTSPLIELKFLRSLRGDAASFRKEKLSETLEAKVSAVRKLRVPREFAVDDAGAGEIKSALKRIVERTSPSNAAAGGQPALAELFALLGLVNLLSAESLLLQFPLLLARRRMFCALHVLSEKNAAQQGLYLSLRLEDDREIGFLVCIDHQMLKCTVSASDETLERGLVGSAENLLRNLRSAARNRSVTLEFVPFLEHLAFASRAMKRVDVRM
jgi:hypothetical protein